MGACRTRCMRATAELLLIIAAFQVRLQWSGGQSASNTLPAVLSAYLLRFFKAPEPANLSSATAGALGLRPCSHDWTLLTDTPSNSANRLWLSLHLSRIRLTSLLFITVTIL